MEGIAIKSNYKIPSFCETDFTISSARIREKEHLIGRKPHNHPFGEIYINLTGDISFFCDGRVYPLARGDILFTRPGQVHHCVYRSDLMHEYVCIFFEYENNRHIWDDFFGKTSANVLRPDIKDKERLIKICNRMLFEQDLSDGEKTALFWEMMIIMRDADAGTAEDGIMPGIFSEILSYIDQNPKEKLLLENICDKFFISSSTLLRYFKKYMNMKPAEYIRHSKLSHAAQLLKSGKGVMQTAFELGYTDESYFIEIFKKHFGVTPLKYKNK